MKFIVCLLAVILTSATVEASGYGGGGGGGGGGGYGGESIPAPPCPKNYLFGCQPQLSPVPCASGGGYGGSSGGGGSSGAYSENVPAILTAPYSYPTVAQNFHPVPNYFANF